MKVLTHPLSNALTNFSRCVVDRALQPSGPDFLLAIAHQPILPPRGLTLNVRSPRENQASDHIFRFNMALAPKDAELFVGVVARIGVDPAEVCSTLARLLREYEYEPIQIKATDALREFEEFASLPDAPLVDRYEARIGACNSLRETTGLQDVMARLAISRISTERAARDPQNDLLRRRAFLINQLKRPEECELLRSLYGEQYIQISCHALASVRETLLAELIAHDNPRKPKAADWRVEAQQLIQRDEAEEDIPCGQRLRDVFPLSDVVVDASDQKQLVAQLDRFLRVFFGDPRVTPSMDEYGMHLANAASLRSADLSRQVGASILNLHAEVQALGCNEVPKAGGGTYWEGDVGDAREFQLGKDSNEERKREVFMDLLGRLSDAGVLKGEFKSDAQVKSILAKPVVAESRLMDSLEYGRTIHAEMNAITDAARGGHALRGCTLYCNTFPCHNCTKHIVAAGLARVVFLRPYPKSFAEDLFSDSIAVESGPGAKSRVAFDQFVGISGAMYERVFAKRTWKTANGRVPRFQRRSAHFVRRTPAPAYREAELVVQTDVGDALQKADLKVLQQSS